MKLYIYALALLTILNSLAMQQEKLFDLSAHLQEHKWHERLAALSPEQRGKLASFFGKQETDSGDNVPREQLAPIITQAMDYAEGKDILHLAVLDNSPEGIKRAVRMGANLYQLRDRKSLLFWAIILNKCNATQALVEHGVDVNERVKVRFYKERNLLSHNAPLSEALRLDRFKIAELLIRNGARQV